MPAALLPSGPILELLFAAVAWWFGVGLRFDRGGCGEPHPSAYYTIEPSLFCAGTMTGTAPMRLRLGPAVRDRGGTGAWLGGRSYSSEGSALYMDLAAYSCRLEGDIEPTEDRWLPTLVKLRAVDTRLFGGGTSSLQGWGGFSIIIDSCMLMTADTPALPNTWSVPETVEQRCSRSDRLQRTDAEQSEMFYNNDLK